MRKFYKRNKIGKQKWLKIFLFSLVFFMSFFLIKKDYTKTNKLPIESHNNYEKTEESKKPVYEYGIQLDSFDVIKKVVKKGENIASIWANYNMFFLKDKILIKSIDIFDFTKKLNASNQYTVLLKNDTGRYFIYEKDKLNYVVVDVNNTEKIVVYEGKKEVIIKPMFSHGVINSSLSEACLEQNVSQKLSQEISEIYAWTIDFFKIQKGDMFKVYYENNYIDSCGKQKYIGVGKILAAEFTHKNQSFYAFYYEQNGNFGEYFDENGMTLRKAFLKAPLNYYRISSRYSKNRKHPVTGQWKGHFGTDYAAPAGTPIMTTANGTIETASYTKYNGYYVKVKHNSTYSTQYLHMQQIKSDIKKGVYVKQGDIIGYVGSTGLATGPHVCYRFWKNGVQVDPYKQKLPPGDPIDEKNKTSFLKDKDDLLLKLTQTQM
jgi:murein DD-endopeptidase MepM/ murein hydrolase activator NlpD